MNRQAILQTTLYLALFIFFTLFFISFNYPSERLTDQINGWIFNASGGTLTVGKARVKPLLSLELERINLKLEKGLLDLGGADVDIHLLAFLWGKRGADARLENPWLSSDLTLLSSGEGWDVDVQVMEIDLSKLPNEIMTLPLRLNGKVGAVLNLLSSYPSTGISSGDIRITSEPIEIGGEILEALGIAPIRISRVSGVASIKDNVVTLKENAIEGDIMATARGAIWMDPADYSASRLDITVDLSPGPGTRERLLPVFKLLGAHLRADGTINFRVRGTLGRTAITM
jgi:type II secretion system protein N